MTKPIRYQTIKGVRYRFLDLGCEDLELAKRNREMVAQNRFIDYWIRLEAMQDSEEIKEFGWLPQIRKR